MFKTLDQVLKADPRYDAFVVVEPEGLRRMTIADHHAPIAALELSPAAPAEVHTLFERARHVLLYAWFDYELTPLADLQALAALELALRQRFSGKGLHGLAAKAVAEGLFEPMLGILPLPKALSMMRNHWAHGSGHFGTPSMSLDVLQLCAGLIGRLYPAGAESTSS